MYSHVSMFMYCHVQSCIAMHGGRRLGCMVMYAEVCSCIVMTVQLCIAYAWC